MSTTLCTMRHARASGQGREASLLLEGEAYAARLGRLLAREGLRPAAAFCSPYRRARDTATIVLAELASDVAPLLLAELSPDADARDALAALAAHGLPAGPVLVVTHLPLVARLAHAITGATLDFPPGAWAEFELAPGARTGRLRRRLGPADIGG